MSSKAKSPYSASLTHRSDKARSPVGSAGDVASNLKSRSPSSLVSDAKKAERDLFGAENMPPPPPPQLASRAGPCSSLLTPSRGSILSAPVRVAVRPSPAPASASCVYDDEKVSSLGRVGAFGANTPSKELLRPTKASVTGRYGSDGFGVVVASPPPAADGGRTPRTRTAAPTSATGARRSAVKAAPKSATKAPGASSARTQPPAATRTSRILPFNSPPPKSSLAAPHSTSSSPESLDANISVLTDDCNVDVAPAPRAGAPVRRLAPTTMISSPKGESPRQLRQQGTPPTPPLLSSRELLASSLRSSASSSSSSAGGGVVAFSSSPAFVPFSAAADFAPSSCDLQADDASSCDRTISTLELCGGLSLPAGLSLSPSRLLATSATTPTNMTPETRRCEDPVAARLADDCCGNSVNTGAATIESELGPTQFTETFVADKSRSTTPVPVKVVVGGYAIKL